MQIGQLVESRSYPEKGYGIIINFHTFADQEQAAVFFEKTKEKMLLPSLDCLQIAYVEFL